MKVSNDFCNQPSAKRLKLMLRNDRHFHYYYHYNKAKPAVSSKASKRVDKPTEKGKAAVNSTPPQKPVYPGVEWSKDGYALTNEFFGILEDIEYLKRTIWPVDGDKATGIKKSTAHTDIAVKLLQSNVKYARWSPEAKYDDQCCQQ